jgi:hypothetical protein
MSWLGAGGHWRARECAPPSPGATGTAYPVAATES